MRYPHEIFEGVSQDAFWMLPKFWCNRSQVQNGKRFFWTSGHDLEGNLDEPS